jgi:hypothetical protein
MGRKWDIKGSEMFEGIWGRRKEGKWECIEGGKWEGKWIGHWESCLYCGKKKGSGIRTGRRLDRNAEERGEVNGRGNEVKQELN